jgi:hypothetical protein
VDDPNGVHTPTDPDAFALYYKDQADPVIMWGWSVTNQNWFAIMT